MSMAHILLRTHQLYLNYPDNNHDNKVGLISNLRIFLKRQKPRHNPDRRFANASIFFPTTHSLQRHWPKKISNGVRGSPQRAAADGALPNGDFFSPSYPGSSRTAILLIKRGNQELRINENRINTTFTSRQDETVSLVNIAKASITRAHY